MRTVCAVFALVVSTLAAEGRVRAVGHRAGSAPPQSVLWIAAHPDDEAVAAPLLAYWCRDLGARCTMLVLTRGEAGACLLPDGCEPDVSAVRSAEHGSATAYFGADSILLSLPDGGGVTAPPWAGSDELASMLARYIEAVRPERILTFDPRHGTTCHPDHRETGRLVLAAVASLATPPAVHLLQTRVSFQPDGSLRFSAATPAAMRFDANQILAWSGETAWRAVIDDMRRHPSQFDDSWITAVENVPEPERAVYYAGPEVLVDGCE